jgi:hypothetical protein
MKRRLGDIVANEFERALSHVIDWALRGWTARGIRHRNVSITDNKGLFEGRHNNFSPVGAQLFFNFEALRMRSKIAGRSRESDLRLSPASAPVRA